MRKIRRLVNGLMQRTCTASCNARVRPHARRWTALCILRVRPHVFFVYGIMHFYVDSLMQALFIVHTYLYQGFIFYLDKCNTRIFNTQNKQSEILYLHNLS